jgi:uncharacterized membrane protein
MAKRSKKPAPTPSSIPQKQEQQIKKLAVQAVAEKFSGPLPPPKILQQYDQIAPGSAERIISMAESQSKHRQEIERIVITSDTKNARLGLHYGLIIGLAAVVGGVLCIMNGYEVSGSIVGGTGLTGLVGVFVYGSRQRRKEREERLKTQMNSLKDK